jgi:hypothetical protein
VFVVVGSCVDWLEVCVVSVGFEEEQVDGLVLGCVGGFRGGFACFVAVLGVVTWLSVED